jgi:hypothetical protein
VGNTARCTCGLCAIERSIATDLGSPESQTRFRSIADKNEILVRYSSVADLVTYLQALRSEADSDQLSDRIYRELLLARWPPGDDLPHQIFLLALMPALHAGVRQVSASYPSLARDDLVQQAVIALLSFFHSNDWTGRKSHFAFAATRKIKRGLFLWARNEFRAAPEFAERQLRGTMPVLISAEESFERAATLRNFLRLCHEQGYLDTEELNLLVDLKLEGTFLVENGRSVRGGSNAIRQKAKRLLNRLRQHARVRNPDQTLLFAKRKTTLIWGPRATPKASVGLPPKTPAKNVLVRATHFSFSAPIR